MELMDLVQLYRDKVPSSSHSSEQLIEELTWLTSGSWSSESIFFSINYCSQYYPEELKSSIKRTLVGHYDELNKYYQLAVMKRDIRTQKESEIPYDSRNTVKGTDTPSWLRKSIDFDLFK